jgi:hypothetical protein
MREKEKKSINDKLPINRHHTPHQEKGDSMVLLGTQWKTKFGQPVALNMPPKKHGRHQYIGT